MKNNRTAFQRSASYSEQVEPHFRDRVIACLFISSLFMLAGCATPQNKSFPPPKDYIPLSQLSIPDRFEDVKLTTSNLDEVITKCVPTIPHSSEAIANKLRNMNDTNISGFGHTSSANVFIAYKSNGFCLNRSSNKYPVLAAEAFEMTVNPSGVAKDVLTDWYKQISMKIANDGSASVLYTFENGNAQLAKFWFDPPQSFILTYTSSFMKAGTWENKSYDLKFSHPSMTGVSEVKRGNTSRKPFLIDHRVH
ncbi:MAG: hypothetical protein C0406_05305 [Sideroxydans sp.]|nr:hypothetical protein [Sideroxydans sp.]